MTRSRRFPRWAIVAAVAVLLCGGLLLAFRLSPQRQARQLGEEFLRRIFTASPQDREDPNWYTEEGITSRYGELVTPALMDQGAANRYFAYFSTRAAEENTLYQPREVELTLSQEEPGRLTYLFSVQGEALPLDGGDSLAFQATGVLVLVEEDGRWLADYLRIN